MKKVYKYTIFDLNGNFAGQTDNLEFALDFIKKIGGEIYSPSGYFASSYGERRSHR